jgi:hypothetical protein
MSKVSNTLYVVQQRSGAILQGTASFDIQDCKRKFLYFYTGENLDPSEFRRIASHEGQNILSINLPKELDKFND